MTKYKYGNPEAPIVLIQPVGDHDLPEIEGEVAQIRKLTALDFQMIAVKVDDWNLDLSPWKAPAVFGNEDFGEGAASLLEEILRLCSDESKTYYLGGYSLAGLFSLWASYQTDRFAGIAAASPSVWFPGFLSYMKEHENQSRAVYLSLGDREEKTRNAVWLLWVTASGRLMHGCNSVGSAVRWNGIRGIISEIRGCGPRRHLPG